MTTARQTALETRLIAGAGFDVLTKEPPKEGNPLLARTVPTARSIVKP
jgi:glycerate dehydrogenase